MYVWYIIYLSICVSDTILWTRSLSHLPSILKDKVSLTWKVGLKLGPDYELSNEAEFKKRGIYSGRSKVHFFYTELLKFLRVARIVNQSRRTPWIYSHFVRAGIWKKMASPVWGTVFKRLGTSLGNQDREQVPSKPQGLVWLKGLSDRDGLGSQRCQPTGRRTHICTHLLHGGCKQGDWK